MSMTTYPCRLGMALVVLAGSIGFPATADGQWTRFRGPNGTGVATSANVPVEFGPEKNVAWKTPLPPGHSSPVLTGDRIFLTAHTDDKNTYKLLVLCLDRKSGALLWQREVPRVQKGRLQNVNGPASPSPVTDGANVYVFFQEFGLIAFDAAGVEKWRRPMGPFSMFYGFGASPILVDDLLILAVDQDIDSYLIAIDKNTGKTRWRVARPGVISGYSTPTVYQPKSGPKQIIVPESFQVSSYSVSDGKRAWWVRGLACEMKSVVSIDDEYLYINGWGFPQNQPGQQVPTVPFAEGRKRYDRNNDGVIAKEEIAGDGPMDRVLSPKYGFDAFDLDRNGRLDAKEWDVFRMMMASENGLLGIKLGGQGDMTSSAIRWRYQRPVPQVPSTLLYQGVLFMVNDSGILTSFDPATGGVLKQGRLKGAIDKYFASPVGAAGKVWLISQDGTVSVVSAKGDWEVLAVNTLGDEVFATPAIADGTLYVRTRNALYGFSEGASPSGNWPHWRGPAMNGVVAASNLPVRWSATENIAWKLALPDFSGSTPIVWGDRIFLNVAAGTELHLLAVDRRTGVELWKKHLGTGNAKIRKQNMSSPSPVTDGRHVWVMTGTGVLKAFDFDGRELWTRDIQKDYGPFGLNWGYASSPLLHRGVLYVQVLHGMKTDDPSYVLAIETLTGKTRWRVERPTDAVAESPDSYTTPALLRYEGKEEIVVTGGDYVTGHDPATGQEVWRAGGLNPSKDRSYRIVASPIVAGGMIYVPSRVRPLMALKPGGRGDVSTSHVVWTTDQGPDVPTPATDGKYIFILNDRGILWCRDAKTGAEIWGSQRARPGTYSASPVVADGRLYVTSEDGVTTVLEAGPEFKVLAENDLADYTLSSPAISDGQIFMRTQKFLYCIGKRAGS